MAGIRQKRAGPKIGLNLNHGFLNAIVRNQIDRRDFHFQQEQKAFKSALKKRGILAWSSEKIKSSLENSKVKIEELKQKKLEEERQQKQDLTAAYIIRHY